MEKKEIEDNKKDTDAIKPKEKKTSTKNVKKKKADLIKEELHEMKDKYTRLYAEFDNYKKRTTKERIELFKTAGTDVVFSLLPILDDFERAFKSLESGKENQSAKEGMELIYNKLKNILESKGLKPMKTIEEKFNAESHEAISEIVVDDKKKSGLIIDEVEKGYVFNDKVIRHARVVVAK